ncbi:Hypothetical protein RMHFA_05781 [Roseomonas mucosa]|uniref:hypothetical protein n=1 Tax=Roseomonas TaxID=125216 RepID=UPI000F7FAC55|nr:MULTISPECIES: hypothetical protein [Roseomonas]UZO95774.1 Hypothetical protein RMHFA_05781 [Roseomonas mucosa]
MNVSPRLEGPEAVFGEVETVVRRLRALAAQIGAMSRRSMTNPRLRALHDEVLATLDEADRLRPVVHLHERHDLQDLRDLLMKLNLELHLQTEIDFAKSFLSSPGGTDPFSGSWINKGFFSLLEGQIQHWQSCGLVHEAHSRIAVVGGGALPQTQIFLHKALGCPVISIDRDGESAELCDAILKRLGYAPLSVIHADGLTHHYAGFSTVVVATLVQGKDSIARRVAETSDEAIFAPRTPTGNHRFWREPVNEEELERQGWSLLGSWAPENSSVASLVFRRGR